MKQTFAQISPGELGSILALFVGMLTGFYALVKYMLKQQENVLVNAAKIQELDRKERNELTKAFNRVAEATETAAREAKERNGHLAELTIESKKATLDAIACIKVKQNVKEQHVDNQVVEHEQLKEKG